MISAGLFWQLSMRERRVVVGLETEYGKLLGNERPVPALMMGYDFAQRLFLMPCCISLYAGP